MCLFIYVWGKPCVLISCDITVCVVVRRIDEDHLVTSILRLELSVSVCAEMANLANGTQKILVE